MKHRHFEIEDDTIVIIVFVLLFGVILFFGYLETKVKEDTKQLELKKEIIMLEKEKDGNGNN